MRLAGGSAEMSTDASGSFGVAEGHDERCRRRVGLSLTYSFVRHADICPYLAVTMWANRRSCDLRGFAPSADGAVFRVVADVIEGAL
jgi:hypothetical protein